MTADEPVAGVPRLCARRADCTRPRGHDDECGPDRADTELADLRAEVERLSVLAEDWRGRYVEAHGDAQRWEDATDTAEAERDALQRQVLDAEVRLSQSVPAFYGWATYDDGSRSDLEWWVKVSDDDWVSLNSERRTTGDIMVEHFSCWPVDGPPHAAGVRP